MLLLRFFFWKGDWALGPASSQFWYFPCISSFPKILILKSFGKSWGNFYTKFEFHTKFIMTVCSCHVTYAFHSESTPYSCLNVKELLAWNRREIWSLSDCNWARTHNHLVRKRTLNIKSRIKLNIKMLYLCH